MTIFVLLMTQERFSRIADDPELLRNITYEELKTLALAYPYAHNLWYLLAIKARQIDHPDVVKNVATAAAYSLDRTQLFRLVAPQMIAPQEVWMEEEILELKPIETLKRKLEEELTPVQIPDQEAEASLEAIPDATPADATIVAAIPQEIRDEEESELVLEIPQLPYMTYGVWYSRFNLPLLLPDTETALPVESVAEPSVETNDQPVDTQQVESGQEEDQVDGNAHKPGSIAQILAEKSVAENKDVISETLAKLFAKQGYREKAITMYERLILAFPEKSSYFAAEIDKLKK